MKLGNRLKVLFKEENVKLEGLTEFLSLKNPSKIYDWLSTKSNPKINDISKIADYLNCSVDYILGRTEDIGKNNYFQTKPFDEQLKKIMKEYKTTQYKMEKDKICTPSHFYKWFELKVQPQLKTLIKLADYFGISVDYLLGRE